MTMESDSREALRILTTAFEVHLDAIASRRGPEDAAVDDAYDALAEAYERYEEALDDEYGESAPFIVDESDADDDFADEDDDEDDDDSEAEVVETDEILDDHAEEDEDELDDDIVEFDLKS